MIYTSWIADYGRRDGNFGISTLLKQMQIEPVRDVYSTQSFSINWSPGNFPNIEIEQIAGTHHDMDM